VNKLTILAAAIIAGLSACSSLENESINTDVDNAVTERTGIASGSSYMVLKTPYAKKEPVKVANRGTEWLKSKTIAFNRNIDATAGVSFKEILRAFNDSGVNVVTTLPIVEYSYQGMPIHSGTTADTALDILTEQVGLDYVVNYKPGSTPYVSITEMGTSEYRLQVADVVTSLSMSSPSIVSQQSGENSTQSGAQSQGQSQGQSGGQSQGGQGQQNSSGQSGGVYTYYQSAFWERLGSELREMMKIMVPASVRQNRSVAPQQGVDFVTDPNLPQSFSMDPQPFSASAPTGSDGLVEATAGRVTVNSATGHITVTAPSHIRKRVIDYVKSIDDELNTRMVVEARIVSVTRSAEETSGIDIAGFKNFASDKYGLAVTNNVLGQISVSDAADAVRRASADEALSQALIGITRADKAFEAFFAYMQSQGSTQSISHLEGSSLSGRTLNLRQAGTDPVLRNSTSQAITDGGTSVGGSSSQIDYNWTGTSAKILPVYNAKRGVINSTVDIELILDAGEKPQTESIVAGDNIEFRTINLKKQILVNIQAASVARAGEVIIAGGVRTKQQVDAGSGVTGLRDTLVGDLFGKRSTRTLVTDYFVLLSVNVQPYTSE
jgi:hypothetical protein